MSLYMHSVPTFVRLLSSLSGIVDKAAAYCDIRGISPEALLHFRLYPDMWPLTRQIQVTCDQAAKACARLTGAGNPPSRELASTFAELNQQIRTATDYIVGFKKEQFADSENRQFSVQGPVGTMIFNGEEYLRNFALPNVYFHATTAYNIFRHNGIEIGKADFLGLARS